MRIRGDGAPPKCHAGGGACDAAVVRTGWAMGCATGMRQTCCPGACLPAGAFSLRQDAVPCSAVQWPNHPPQVWRGDAAALPEGQELTWSAEAYNMLHRFNTPWPCLSFDIIPDAMGAGRSRYPHTAYLVAGATAPNPRDNKLYVMKLSDMHRTQNDDNDDDPDAVVDDADVDDDAVLTMQAIPHPGPVNRVSVMPHAPHVVASWAETGGVHLWDVRHKLAALDLSEQSEGALGKSGAAAVRGGQPPPSGPAFSFMGHASEGFSLAWSGVHAGRLASGDTSGGLFVWDPLSGAQATSMGGSAGGSGPGVLGATWRIRPSTYTGHTGSVEDLQWSPNESEVLASCSTDRSVCIWDTREPRRPAMQFKANAAHDINVISWNRKVPFLVLSGSDDGEICVWDLRELNKAGGNAEPLARSSWHRKAITSIEWSPHDENCLVACSEDDSVSLWDMSLEPETGADAAAAKAAGADDTAQAGPDIPAQLLFVHQGQSQIKEAHFHEQIPGAVITTSGSGFNVFKPDVKLA